MSGLETVLLTNPSIKHKASSNKRTTQEEA